MDFSKVYIKMCKEAKELQQDRKPSDGDYYSCENKILLIPWHNVDDKIIPLLGIWLPRQDQIQALITYGDGTNDIDDDPINLLTRFYDWFTSYAMMQMQENSTLEILWLAFLMRENYGKKWYEDTWRELSRKESGHFFDK